MYQDLKMLVISKKLRISEFKKSDLPLQFIGDINGIFIENNTKFVAFIGNNYKSKILHCLCD